MATKHDEFKVYYFSFTSEELATIIGALRDGWDRELADEISDQVWPEGDCEETVSIGKLTIDLDYSAATEARSEIDKLTCAVDALADSYDRLSDAMKGAVEYSLDATDRLIKELLAGVAR